MVSPTPLHSIPEEGVDIAPINETWGYRGTPRGSGHTPTNQVALPSPLGTSVRTENSPIMHTDTPQLGRIVGQIRVRSPADDSVLRPEYLPEGNVSPAYDTSSDTSPPGVVAPNTSHQDSIGLMVTVERFRVVALNWVKVRHHVSIMTQMLNCRLLSNTFRLSREPRCFGVDGELQLKWKNILDEAGFDLMEVTIQHLSNKLVELDAEGALIGRTILQMANIPGNGAESIRDLIECLKKVHTVSSSYEKSRSKKLSWLKRKGGLESTVLSTSTTSTPLACKFQEVFSQLVTHPLFGGNLRDLESLSGPLPEPSCASDPNRPRSPSPGVASSLASSPASELSPLTDLGTFSPTRVLAESLIEREVMTDEAPNNNNNYRHPIPQVFLPHGYNARGRVRPPLLPLPLPHPCPLPKVGSDRSLLGQPPVTTLGPFPFLLPPNRLVNLLVRQPPPRLPRWGILEVPGCGPLPTAVRPTTNNQSRFVLLRRPHHPGTFPPSGLSTEQINKSLTSAPVHSIGPNQAYAHSLGASSHFTDDVRDLHGPSSESLTGSPSSNSVTTNGVNNRSASVPVRSIQVTRTPAQSVVLPNLGNETPATNANGSIPNLSRGRIYTNRGQGVTRVDVRPERRVPRVTERSHALHPMGPEGRPRGSRTFLPSPNPVGTKRVHNSLSSAPDRTTVANRTPAHLLSINRKVTCSAGVEMTSTPGGVVETPGVGNGVCMSSGANITSRTATGSVSFVHGGELRTVEGGRISETGSSQGPSRTNCELMEEIAYNSHDSVTSSEENDGTRRRRPVRMYGPLPCEHMTPPSESALPEPTEGTVQPLPSLPCRPPLSLPGRPVGALSTSAANRTAADLSASSHTASFLERNLLPPRPSV